jgi:hypothetical protein
MTTTTRQRSASPSAAGSAKKAKVGNGDINLPVGEKLDSWKEKYSQSTPYKHAVVPGLLTDDLVSDPWQLVFTAAMMRGCAVLICSSKASSRRAVRMASEGRKGRCPDGDGSRKRRISTRWALVANCSLSGSTSFTSFNRVSTPIELLGASNGSLTAVDPANTRPRLARPRASPRGDPRQAALPPSTSLCALFARVPGVCPKSHRMRTLVREEDGRIGRALLARVRDVSLSTIPSGLP